MTIKINRKINKFKASATSEQEIDSQNLIGQNYVIYFYPKDNTPGCTQEGEDFRDLYKEFKKLNIETNKSSTNFLLINFDKVKKNSSKIFELLAEAGILVRKMNNYNIKNSLRITIGKNDENKKLILKLKEAINV